MTNSEQLLKQAERLAGLRRGLLLVNAFAYMSAIGAMGLSHAGGYGFDAAQLNLTQMIAWPLWFVSLLGVLWTMRRAARPEIGALIDDERTANLKDTAFQAGYWTLLLSVALVFAATYLMPIDIKLVLPFMLAVGVAAPPLTYAFLYRG